MGVNLYFLQNMLLIMNKAKREYSHFIQLYMGEIICIMLMDDVQIMRCII